MMKSRRSKWTGHIARMKKGRSALKMLTSKPTRKNPLGRPRHRLEDKVRMDLEEIGVDVENWVDWAQGKEYFRTLVNSTLNLWVRGTSN